MRFNNLYGFVTVIIENGDETKYFNVKGETSKYKSPSDTFTVNIGSVAAGGEVKVSFWCGGLTFEMEDMEVYALPLDDYPEQAAALAEHTLENLDIDANTITGTLSLDDAGLLYLSIPYSGGWTAYVDGEKADILKANIAYMAIEVGPGDHDIRLVYCTPGLKAGAAISLVALACLVVLALLRKRKVRNS